jgi:hypothetical protein
MCLKEGFDYFYFFHHPIGVNIISLSRAINLLRKDC